MTHTPPPFNYNNNIPIQQQSLGGSYYSDEGTLSYDLERLKLYSGVVETPELFTTLCPIVPPPTGMLPHQEFYPYAGTNFHDPDRHFSPPTNASYEQQYTPGATSQYDGLAVREHKILGMAQAPLEPLDRRIVCEHVRTRPASGNWCGDSCIGQLNGYHQCLFPSEPPSIVCFGNSECRKIFRSRVGFNRHWSTKHRQSKTPEKRRLNCPFHGCSRIGVNGFSRPDNLRQHRRSVHGEDIPKEKRMFSGIRRAAGRVRKV